jgi:hypothetical protein
MNIIFAHATSVPEVDVNILAVLIATAAAMAIGSLWYGPLFGDKWMKLVKLNKKDAGKNWQKPMLTMLILALVQAFILSHFIVYSGYFYPDLNSIVLGAITGFWAFVGFALPAVLANNMFARRPNELSTIEVGNQLVTLVTMGVIIGAFL